MGLKATRDLEGLAAAPSQSEREKAARTHTMIREYLETAPALKKYRIDTFLQGSYKNSTNVRGDSDVDLGSETHEVFYYDTEWLPSTAQDQYGRPKISLKESVDKSLSNLGKGDFTFVDYRADVLASLASEYGAHAVIDGNKAITVRGNTNRLDADVLPCISFRQYFQDSYGQARFHDGIAFFTKQLHRIVNFPKQHFDNLAVKDQRTGGKVKGCIRILKRIRNDLEEHGQWDRRRSPSFYLESLVWNAPDDHFVGGYDSVLENVLRRLYRDLHRHSATDERDAYTQANQIFPLFHSRFWNEDDAKAFITMVWADVFSVTP
jgi:hypothetical protein